MKRLPEAVLTLPVTCLRESLSTLKWPSNTAFQVSVLLFAGLASHCQTFCMLTSSIVVTIPSTLIPIIISVMSLIFIFYSGSVP